jgi:two-component system phosphate regulon response regulator PhoB
MPKHHVLIIEDDRSLSDVLLYNLEQAGYSVAVAFDGQDGVNHAQSRVPDVVLLDLMLPEMDGLEVCRRLRSSAATKDALVVMLTAKSEENDQVVGLAMGADDYVTKPFSVRVLLERVKALLRRRASGRKSSLKSGSGASSVLREASRVPRKSGVLPPNRHPLTPAASRMSIS